MMNWSYSQSQNTTDSSAIALVDRQIEAYNNRDIDAFMSCYSKKIKIREFNGKIVFRGQKKMRILYSQMFNELNNLHCEIQQRIVKNGIIIDHEFIRGFPNKKEIHAVAIYTVENGKIIEVIFI